ncbi:MAG TPA: 2,4'-dihydroxyacetophenone dioxygenase family protein [Acidimicrobiales bacterium]|nr:2,4'-dihydroxyacetophenone dioxygenase family protein [Acidimicrobiales bacterium]
MDIGHVLNSTEAHASGDQLLDPGALPWVPQAEGVYFRPLRICPELGSWTNLLRVTKKGTINLHRHVAPVEAWVISGQWRYLERDWVARPGTYVFEPAGDVHTLVNTGEEEMVTLFCMHGPIEYIGRDGETIFTETAETKLSKYVSFCEANGISLAPIIG